MEKKFRNCGEVAFVLGTVLLGLGTALMSKASFGMSIVVSPAYVLADAVGRVSAGTMCYICQGFLVLCTFAMLRRFKPAFVFTFLSAVLFGLTVDFFTDVCLGGIVDPGMGVRVLLFCLAMPINSLSIAFLLKSYLPPQAPELFVKELSAMRGWDMYKTKYAYDIASCLLSVALSFLFFRQLRFVGVGTFISALLNAPLIAFFGKSMEKAADFSPRISWLGKMFSTENRDDVEK